MRAAGPLREISIHALREEGDSHSAAPPFSQSHFYPRPPRGGRRLVDSQQDHLGTISIHALREEGDHRGSSQNPKVADFYPRPPRGGRPDAADIGLCRRGFLSTPSARRATRSGLMCFFTVCISIHALREEGDLLDDRTGFGQVHFYPRPPRGGRPECSGRASLFSGISIHALREEGDNLW